MATNPLYLNTPPSTEPSTEKEHSVKLTLVSSNGKSNSNESLSDLMHQMCAMIQLLHLVEGELALNQTKMASLNNTAAEVNVEAVNAQGAQAVANAQKALQLDDKPWWEKLLMAVFSVVMVVLAYVTFGVTAAILAAVIIVITTVPLPFLGGKTLMGFISSKIAEAIGKANGWSQAKIQEVTGYINLAFGVVLAALSFGMGFAGASVEVANAAVTIGEDVVEEGLEMTEIGADGASSIAEDSASATEETAEETAKTASQSSKAAKVGTFAAVQALTSQAANSNCISDIMMGTLMSGNPNASDKEKEIIEGIAVALSILVAVVGAVLGGKLAISSVGEDLEEGASVFSKIASKLGTSAKALIGAVETANGVVEGGMNIYQGAIAIEIGQLNAAVTRLMGGMESSKEISALISQTMNQINTMLKDYTSEYSALENNLKNIGRYDGAEVTALLQANQSA